ncbi:response regulator [Microvirga terrae]|uniref:Response regulator n=1 Tax=Microvirga terrae TaxID=2740529 RepID=A0ABY5RMK7_9HYPH|nr:MULTISPECIES: response regulator [Microvirga]MBQ0821990.1 response regulator [Microvirga sp. HBU67558]UVF17584.1 response regulator [Microvirga terrae]
MATTVLIVDDSKLARIVAGKALAVLQPDWERIEAGNAQDALDIIRHRKIDLAMIDYNMPEKDGLELAAELRAIHPTMPIAVITANIQDEVIARAREVNATFVSKPLTEDGLRGFISGAALRLRSGGTPS